MDNEESNKYFYVWKPEDNPVLFCKIRDEAARLNDLNPDLIKINHNTWKYKDNIEDKKSVKNI